MASTLSKTKLAEAGPEPEEPPEWGMTDEQLATHPTVFAPDLLNDQVALISGGGSGMGKAMAFLMSRLGAKVVICGRREHKLAADRRGHQQSAGQAGGYACHDHPRPGNGR